MTKLELEELKNMIPIENIKYNEPMSKHTSFKTGGNAKCFVIAKNENEIKMVIKFCKEKNINLYIIGNGSNLLVSDKGLDGIVLKIAIDFIEICEENQEVIINVGAGTKIMALAQKLKIKEIAGFEELSGIPRNYWWSKCNECRSL